jgi:hypothetical protein
MCCWAQAVREGDVFTCPECGKKIDVGEKFKLISHERIDGMGRADLHSLFKEGATCWLHPCDFEFDEEYPSSGRFYIEYENGEVHTITTSTLKQSYYDGKVLTAQTRNTNYKFEKVE